jgi:hypothetical protein
VHCYHRCSGTCAASVIALCGPVVLAGCGGQVSTGGASAASGAKCGASPRRLVDLDALAASMNVSAFMAPVIAVDTTDVFFGFGSSLMRAPLRGGPPVTLARVDLSFFGVVLATSMGAVFEVSPTNRPNGSIVRVSPAGGAPVTLATLNGEPGAIATDGTAVYFADGTSIESVPLAGGAPPRTLTVLADTTQQFGIQPVTGLAVVGSQLVMTEGGVVASMPLHGGSPQTLATGQSAAMFPMPCGTGTCWWTGTALVGDAGSAGPGNIEWLSPGAETMISGAPFSPTSLAFDGTSFFETVACDSCAGTLIRIPMSGSAPVTMTPADFVAVDDACAYYSVVSSATGNGIFSVDKSYAGPPAAL